MATQHPQPSGPPKVPLIATVSQRGESATVDSRLINGYVEKLPNGEVVAVKRPGYALYASLPSPGYGHFYWAGSIYAVAGTSLYKDGVFMAAIDITGGKYSFGSVAGATAALFLHNSNHAYYIPFGGALTAIAALTNTYDLAPGCAYLDGGMYVLAHPNTIYGSGPNDLTTWNALNAIQAQMQPEPGQVIFRQLSYVVALKQASTEAFFDAGNPVGSPLQLAQGTYLPYGCRTPTSLQVFEDAALWVTGGTNGVTVMMLENMKPRIVSTPAVERLLQQLDFTNTYTSAFRLYGHRFYTLSLKFSNITLVYDLSTGEWFQWTDPDGNYFPIIGATTTTDNQCILQGENGQLFKLEGTYYTDLGANFPFEIYTPNWDGGTSKKKYLQRLDVMADQAGTGTLFIATSDDDYQTWSNFRQVNLAKNRKSLYNCGTFRKRAWRVKYVANTPLRLRALELSVVPGDV